MSASHQSKEKVYINGMYFDAYLSHINNSKVFDIGCGSGDTARYLQPKDNQCYGITLSEQEAKAAAPYYEDIVVADVELEQELPFSGIAFDHILLFDILEHLKHPEKLLHKLQQRQKPGTGYVISIPNVANIIVRWELLRGRFDYTDKGIMDNTHYRFFTLKSAQELLVNSGLKIDNIIYTNWNWQIPFKLEKIPYMVNSERTKKYLTNRYPGLFATQFIFYCHS